jgi:hypothetical protein
LVFLQAKVAENIVKICPSSILCEAKTFPATYWHHHLDVTVALHVGKKKLAVAFEFESAASNFCH